MSQTSKPKVTVATPVILYGLDKHNKPLAARFPERLCDLALKAAQQLKLNVLQIVSPDVAEFAAAALPVGRINSSGHSLVPNVRQTVYDKVMQMAHSSNPTGSGSTAKTGLALNEEGSPGNPAGSNGLPRSWKEITVNHLVLVQQSLDEGWWEAIVVERRDDMLTVKWRDYTKWKPFVVHADAVALVNATPSFKA
jgi:hypothetical protein